MGDSELTVRPLNPGEEAAVNRAFNEVFQQHRTLAEWYWKFGPPGEPKFVMVAWGPQGEPLAQWAGLPVELWAFGQRLLGAQIVDVFAKKQARKSLGAAGAYLRTMRAFHATWCGPGGFSLLYGFPSARPMLLDQKSGEYVQIPDLAIPVFRRPASCKKTSPLPLGLRFGLDEEAADGLWERVKQRCRLSVVRDGAAFRRRYTARPGVVYHHVVAWERGTPAAYGVFALQPPAVVWAELLWDGESASALEKVLGEGERLGQRAGCRELAGWLRGDPPLELALQDLGFEVAPHPLVRWLGRSFDPRIPPELVPDALHCTMGDSDLV
jgi:hypothetical protein